MTARALAENGARVYITGRREAVLAAAKKSIDAAAQAAGKGGEVRTVTGDMATKEGVVREFVLQEVERGDVCCCSWLLGHPVSQIEHTISISPSPSFRATLGKLTARPEIRDAIAAQETHVNLLVNNHGVSLGRPAFTSATTPEEMSAEMVNNETFERWTDTYTINTTSYYFTTFAFLPLLCKAKEAAVSGGEAGNVIIVSSMSGITNTSQRGQVRTVELLLHSTSDCCSSLHTTRQRQQRSHSPTCSRPSLRAATSACASTACVRGTLRVA